MPEIGATPLTDIGVYTVSFAQWIFRNEKPEKILATGKITNGCDRWGVITLEYSNDRKAVLIFGGVDFTPIDAMVTCENGRYHVIWALECRIFSSQKTSIARQESSDTKTRVQSGAIKGMSKKWSSISMISSRIRLRITL